LQDIIKIGAVGTGNVRADLAAGAKKSVALLSNACEYGPTTPNDTGSHCLVERYVIGIFC